jgi:hypothetical protein
MVDSRAYFEATGLQGKAAAVELSKPERLRQREDGAALHFETGSAKCLYFK